MSDSWWKDFQSARSNEIDYDAIEMRAKPPAPAAPKALPEPDFSSINFDVQSIERTAFGIIGTAFPRQNMDVLAAKKGLGVYAKMRVDEQVKAVVTFKRDAILSRGWMFEFDKETKLSEKEQKRRIRIFEKIIEKMPGSFIDALNVISTGREFGYSLTEKVYKNIECDGKTYVGLDSLRGREPASFEFTVDPYGDLVKCVQVAAGQRIEIDLDKFIHYVHNPEFDVYLGRSDLREAYRAWYVKDQLINFWSLYMEKLGGGALILQIGANSTIGGPTTASYIALQKIAENFKSASGIVLPKDVTATLQFPSNSDAFDKAVTWFDLAIARALLVPNLLGVSHTGQTGAYAQSQTQLEAFAWTLKADADRLESCINEQLFADLGEVNFGDGEYPCFKFKPATTEHIKWLVTSVKELITAGALVATEDDEKKIREILELPPRTEESVPLIDPAKEGDKEHEIGKMEKEHELGEKEKDAQVKRGIEEEKKKRKEFPEDYEGDKPVTKKELKALLFEWDESKHARDDRGRFGEGGAGNEMKPGGELVSEGPKNIRTKHGVLETVQTEYRLPKERTQVNVHDLDGKPLGAVRGRNGRDGWLVHVAGEKGWKEAPDRQAALATLANRHLGVQMAAEWDESKHPRDKDGKFGDGEGGSNEKAPVTPSKDADKLWSEAKKSGIGRGGAEIQLGKSGESETKGRERVEALKQSIGDRLRNNGYGPPERKSLGAGHERLTWTKDGQTRELDISYVRGEHNPNTHSHLQDRGMFRVYYTRGGKKSMTADARSARLNIASARERVDFAVIDQKQQLFGETLSKQASAIVARAVHKLLGDDAQLKALTDTDTTDIAAVEIAAMDRGRLKQVWKQGLAQAWALGRQMASDEIRRANPRRKNKDMAHFANLRDRAQEYFENNGFRMAGNVSDGGRAIIQQELQNSVKFGKSPKQTRETIWDRLTSKGFVSRADVREVETDEGVLNALNELWLDDEAQAAHYLDTLARTNLFESMNEARYGEFTDPALDGFVVALRYSAILDDRTTEICESLHNHVYEADSEVWDAYRPPNHYNCRSILVPVTQVDVENGEWDGEESEEPEVEPQEGFK